MTFKFKYNGKTLTAKVPRCWDEVTVQQFQKMNFSNWDGVDIVHLLSILSGADLKALYETRSKPMKAVYAAMAFLQEEPIEWEALKHKTAIIYKDKMIRIPEDLENEAFGLMIELQQLAESDNIAAICALYLQPVIDGKIDKERRVEIEKDVLKMPVLDILPIVNFFFRKTREYRIYGKPVLNLYQ